MQVEKNACSNETYYYALNDTKIEIQLGDLDQSCFKKVKFDFMFNLVV